LRKLSAALKIIVSVAILLFLFRKANLAQGLQHLSQIRYSYVLLSVVFIVAGQVLRALRLAVMVAGNLKSETIWKILRIQMVSFLPGLVSPAKVGEVTKIYMLRSEMDVPATRGLVCFVMERVLDLALLTPLAMIALYFFFRNGLLFNLKPGWEYSLVAALILLLAAFAGGVIWMRKKELSLNDLWDNVGPDGIIKAGILTILYWNVVFIEVWCFCRASGFSANIGQMGLVVPPALLSSMIPISFSGFGLREAAMVIFLQRPTIGASYEQALLISLMYDIVGLGVPALMGAIFWLRRKDDHAAKT
jgi:uncharacterized membrane protein YbhN (UPF0104 family)